MTLIQLCRLPDMVSLILDGLCPFVVELCSDVNGNHVIKCCLKSMPAELRQRLLDEVVVHCIEVGVGESSHAQISKEMYGCSIIQKCIEIAAGDSADRLFATIEANALDLMRDRYANYVIQVVQTAAVQCSISSRTRGPASRCDSAAASCRTWRSSPRRSAAAMWWRGV